MNWIGVAEVLAVHERLVSEHGGAFGLRDRALLESALSRPRQRLANDPHADVHDLAAEVAFGLARNHPFLDGNKRTAYVAARLFLRLNGADMTVRPEERVLMMVALAAGGMDVAAFAAWLRSPGPESGPAPA